MSCAFTPHAPKFLFTFSHPSISNSSYVHAFTSPYHVHQTLMFCASTHSPPHPRLRSFLRFGVNNLTLSRLPDIHFMRMHSLTATPPRLQSFFSPSLTFSGLTHFHITATPQAPKFSYTYTFMSITSPFHVYQKCMHPLTATPQAPKFLALTRSCQ